jgi:transcription elongation GreA/GreB family factor
MSRAFVKELEDAPERDLVLKVAEPLPITAQGREKLVLALEAASDPAERSRLETILERVYVVAPPDDRSVAAFGATVSVRGAGEEPKRYRLVGPDEVDIPSGDIGSDSPLGEALLGSRVGDTVVWRRPAGDRKLSVRAIEYL